MEAPRGRRRNGPPRKKREPAPVSVEWDPKTKLGKMVRGGKIATIGIHKITIFYKREVLLYNIKRINSDL